VDETGQPGGAAPGINGNGRHHSEHTRQNGTWVSSEPAWTGADAVLEAGFEPVVPIWRRPVDPPPPGLAAQPGGAPRDNGYHPADVEHIRGDLLPAVPDETAMARGSEGDTGGYGPAGPAGPVPPAQAPAGAGAYPYPGTTGHEDTRMDRTQPPIMSDRAPSSEQDIPPQPVRHHAAREDTPLHGVPLVGLPVWQEATQAAAQEAAPPGEHQAGYEPHRPNRGYEPDREYGQQRYDPPGYEAPWDQPTWNEPAHYGRPSHGEARAVPSAVPARPGPDEPIGPGPAGVPGSDVERESGRDAGHPSKADSDRWPEPDADRGPEPDRWSGPTGPRSELHAEAPAGSLPPAPSVEASPAPPPPGPAQPPSADLPSLHPGDRLAPVSGPPSRPVRPVSGPPSRPVRATAGQPSTSERLVGPAALAPQPPRPALPDPVASAPPVSSGPPVTSAPPHSSPPVASAPPVTSGPPVASAPSSTPAPPVEPLPEEPVPPAAPESSAPPAAPESDPRPVSAPPSKHTPQAPPVPPGLRPSALLRPDPSPAGGAQPGPEPRPPQPRGESPAEALPQRVPAEPDVPTVPEPQAEEPPAQAPELARIWSHLRREDVPPRPEGFDVTAVLEAVQQVPGVREAKLRSNPGGGHNLRLELADGADAAQVSRRVTQLLQEQMGLSASPREISSADPAPAASPRPAPETGRGRRRSQSRAESAARGRAQFEPAVPLQRAATAAPPAERSMPTPGPLIPRERPGPRVLIDQVQVTTYGLDATVEVRLNAGPRRSVGLSSGPAADGYLLRLTADAAVKAVNQLLRAEMGVNEPRGQCYLEQAAVIPFGSYEVAVVVVNLACGGWVEQLSGAAMVAGDAHQSVVRAALAALNRRLEGLLS
jgi:hypothetical protein